MRKVLVLCSFAVFLTGCAPTGDPGLRDREERTFPDPALGIKNGESEAYSTQILASPPASPDASLQSAKPAPAKALVPAPAPEK